MWIVMSPVNICNTMLCAINTWFTLAIHRFITGYAFFIQPSQRVDRRAEKSGNKKRAPISLEFRLFNFGSKLLYVIAAFVLLLLSLAMVGMAIWSVISQIVAGKSLLAQLLESVGLIIIAIAVFDVAKFLLEEQVLRERKLQHIAEARRSLTLVLNNHYRCGEFGCARHRFPA
jgi:cytochrome b subunit of formate dehydrogenase